MNKYIWQEHKDKIYLVGGIFAVLIVLAVAAWFIFGSKEETILPFEENTAPSSFIRAHEGGKIEWVTKEGDVLTTVSLEEAGPYAYQMSPSHTSVYAYNGENVYKVTPDGYEKLFTHKQTALTFTATDNAALFYEENKATYMSDTTPLTYEAEETIVQALIVNQSPLLLTNRFLIDMSADTTILTGKENQTFLPTTSGVVILSAFGEGKGRNLLVQVNVGDALRVVDSLPIEATETVLFNRVMGETRVHIANELAKGVYYVRNLASEEVLVETNTNWSVSLTESLESPFYQVVFSGEHVYIQDGAVYKAFNTKARQFEEMAIPLEPNTWIQPFFERE